MELQLKMIRLQFETAAASKPNINSCVPEIEEETDVTSDKNHNLVVVLHKYVCCASKFSIGYEFSYNNHGNDIGNCDNATIS